MNTALFDLRYVATQKNIYLLTYLPDLKVLKQWETERHEQRHRCTFTHGQLLWKPLEAKVVRLQ